MSHPIFQMLNDFLEFTHDVIYGGYGHDERTDQPIGYGQRSYKVIGHGSKSLGCENGEYY